MKIGHYLDDRWMINRHTCATFQAYLAHLQIFEISIQTSYYHLGAFSGWICLLTKCH